ncbi:uncharacterized protein B0I36DRAFT_321629 [Microdochium trichocladiopsis]|uniref:Abc transporter protein n=1 Tax=Microdochium trichocladiopsis TaxID=1682393 RepID=A0A9P8YAD1_9PEZI|nr:uncharacterized protein B0I36DRAFT_321629 [Microdochium trichocladiopsis]KAH7033526.1 hypothetical protein B0I36DRAFT_321629 [Microdochium trichocladiopsis]
MGKPSFFKGPGGPPTSAGSSSRDASDAMSLHTNPDSSSHPLLGNEDDDDDDALQLAPGIDDLPPSYSEFYTDDANAPAAAPTSSATNGPNDPFSSGSNLPVPAFKEDANTLAQFYISSDFELIGTHSRTTRDSKGKTERKTVTDFDVSVDLTPFLYRDATHRKSWSYLRTVENSEKVRRGTVLRKRAPGVKHDLEVGGEAKPGLREWCHRFGASSAGLKCFVLRREMVGFDEAYVRNQLLRLIADTNYRGRYEVRIGMKGDTVEMYNDAKINRWRLTTWVQWLFTLTLLFIFSWPYLFFRTKRWEVAVVDWPFSRMTDGSSGGSGGGSSNGEPRKEYVSLSEEQWYNMWARAIARAVVEKRQTTLTQLDLARAEGQAPAFTSGNQTVDSLFRAGMGAMNAINHQLGWGHDE